MTIPEREMVFGDKNTYHKKGNTAICHFDKFAPNDKEAWNNYYQGKAPRPTLETSPNDPMTIFLDALKGLNTHTRRTGTIIPYTSTRISGTWTI